MAYNKYQYETSPRKLKPEYETIKKTYSKKSTARRAETKKKTRVKTDKVNQAKIILYVAIGFVTLFVISYRYSKIDEVYSDLKGLKTTLGAIEKETAQLEANLESSLNLTKIEQDAKELLGMKKLSDEQIVWVSLPKTDYIETSSEKIKDSSTSSNWLMQIINKIAQTLK